MKQYIIKKVYQYSVEVEVMANDAVEARDLAIGRTGFRNYDDTMVNISIERERKVA